MSSFAAGIASTHLPLCADNEYNMRAYCHDILAFSKIIKSMSIRPFIVILALTLAMSHAAPSNGLAFLTSRFERQLNTRIGPFEIASDLSGMKPTSKAPHAVGEPPASACRFFISLSRSSWPYAVSMTCGNMSAT